MPFTSRPFVLALALAAAGVEAAELGEATVRSYIGQPLSADIELTDLSPQDLAELQARLARPDVFQGANVTMHPALAGANISVVRKDQRRVLHVTTNGPVQAEVLHLFFQLSAGGRDRVRGVSLWLTQDPAPPARVATAPAAPVVAPATAPAAERADKPTARRPADGGPQLVAMAAAGKEATKGERELLGAVERAFAARAPKAPPPPAQPAKPAPSAAEVRREALKYASTADDFKRGAKSAPAPEEKKRKPRARRGCRWRRRPTWRKRHGPRGPASRRRRMRRLRTRRLRTPRRPRRPRRARWRRPSRRP